MSFLGEKETFIYSEHPVFIFSKLEAKLNAFFDVVILVLCRVYIHCYPLYFRHITSRYVPTFPYRSVTTEAWGFT